MGSGKLLGVVLQKVHFVIIEICRVMADGGDEFWVIYGSTAAVFDYIEGNNSAGNVVVVCLLMDKIAERINAEAFLAVSPFKPFNRLDNMGMVSYYYICARFCHYIGVFFLLVIWLHCALVAPMDADDDKIGVFSRL